MQKYNILDIFAYNTDFYIKNSQKSNKSALFIINNNN